VGNPGRCRGCELNRRQFVALTLVTGVATALPAISTTEPRRIAVIKRGMEVLTRNCRNQNAAIDWLGSRCRIAACAWEDIVIEIHPVGGIYGN
jgi:hypothetical protein